jgi:hypothetical protein
MNISAVKVMLTMLTKELPGKKRIEKSMMVAPWKIEIHTQIRKVLKLRERPF